MEKKVYAAGSTKIGAINLRSKMLAAMFTSILILTIILCSVLLSLIRQKECRVQFASCSGSNQQTLTTFEYVSDDMEQYLARTCKAEEIPMLVTEAVKQSSQSYRVSYKLRILLENTNYFDDIFLVDTEGNFYFVEKNANKQVYYTDLWEEGVFSNSRHIFYVQDSAGSSYLCRTIYNTYPLEAVCYVVAKLDMQFLCSLMGLGSSEKGAVAILDHDYQTIIERCGRPEETASLHLIVENRSYLYQQETRDDYHVFAAHTKQNDWHIVRVISDSELFDTFYAMRRTVFVMMIISFLAALVTCYFLSWRFTKNTHRLIKDIERICDGDMTLRLPQCSTDEEILELSRSINWMLECIETATNSAIDEIKARQRMQYELLNFKCRLLQAQVSPHFICNILTAILSFSEAGDQDMVEKLSVLSSRYLRNNLAISDDGLSAIEHEFQQISDYIDLFHMVYATDVIYEAFYEPELKDAVLPSVLLISLVENSLKHGTQNLDDEPFLIRVTANSDEGCLCLTVTDSGDGFSQDVLDEIKTYVHNTSSQTSLLGFGITSIIRRLELQYGVQYRFSVLNTNPKGAVVRIKIPLENKKTKNDDEKYLS